MRLLAIDKKRGWARLAATNSLDLLNLYRVIGPGDKVYQETTREVKKERASGEVDSERVAIKIGIEVEKKSIDPLMRRVRFQGRITFTDRDLDILKKHHTIQVSRGDVIEVESPAKLAYILRMSEDDREQRTGRMVVVSADDEEMALMKIDADGVGVLRTWRFEDASKRIGYKTDTNREEIYDELVENLRKLVAESRPKIVLLGTAIHLDLLAAEIKRRDVGLHGLIAKKIPVNVGGISGLREALRRGALGEELKPLADAIFVERALKAILKHPEQVRMGLEEVAKACGITRKGLVLVTEDFIWENMEVEALDQILSMAERGVVKLRVILSNTEAADKLNSLGGIVYIEKKILEE